MRKRDREEWREREKEKKERKRDREREKERELKSGPLFSFETVRLFFFCKNSYQLFPSKNPSISGQKSVTRVGSLLILALVAILERQLRIRIYICI